MAISARIDELRKKFDENPRRYFAPLANEYRKAGDLDQAIFICQEYLPLQPGHMSGHIVYGQALFDLARNDEAKAVFETALSLDPENLIALRHLGDIARQAGDTTSARIWYQRVLEADPRNEEIAQIMISLLASPASETAAETATRTPDTTPSVPDTPRNSRAVGGAGASTSGAGASLHVEQSQEASPLAAAPEMPPEIPPEMPPPEPEASRPVHELLDIEDFSIGGIAAPAATSAPEREEMPAAEPVSPPEIESDETGVFHLGGEDGPFEADPYAIASSPEVAAADGAARETAGPPDASAPVAEVAPEPEPAAEPTPEVEPVVAGLETFEAGVIIVPPEVAVATSGLATESFFDLEASPPSAPAQSEEAPAVDALSETTAEMEAHSATPAAPAAEESRPPETAEPEPPAQAEAPVEAFVTETMAELYLQQGHVDSALEIYRRLVELRPDESPLQERLRALEDYGNAPAAEPVADTYAMAPAPEHAGPTIREFLVGLTTRRVQEAGVPEPPEELAEPPVEEPVTHSAADASPEYVADSFVDSRAETPIINAAQAEPRVSAARPTPSYATETVSGSIDALFGGANPSTSDANAATTLAEAFATEPPEAPEASEAPQLHGVPAHLASQELSLDHVFKSRTPPRPAGDGFSFDQFFAGDANETTPSGAGDTQSGGAPAEAADDVAQFNAWLNGLKKT